MKIDCHVHTRMGDGYAIPGKYDAKEFASQLSLAGLDGAAIYSPSPKGYKNRSWQERLQLGLDVCKSGENLYPFYWINPTDEDAKEQVDAAILGGYVAFKIIAFDFSVKEKKVLDVISYIAECGKAIMFHSGICWDGMNSCDNLRPSNFEALIDIPNLRFCLAHVS